MRVTLLPLVQELLDRLDTHGLHRCALVARDHSPLPLYTTAGGAAADAFAASWFFAMPTFPLVFLGHAVFAQSNTLTWSVASSSSSAAST